MKSARRPEVGRGTLALVRRLVQALGGFAWAGICLALVSVLCFVAILTSANSWQWWSARSVEGSEVSGVVTYTVAGRSYSINDQGSTHSGTRTVWVDPSNPSNSTLSVMGAQISDTAITLTPLLIALTLLTAGVVRWRRHDRRIKAGQADERAAFGTGLDPVKVRALLDRRGRTEVPPPSSNGSGHH
jgi:hypothetical protein